MNSSIAKEVRESSDGINYSDLRAALESRNVRSWRLGDLSTPVTGVSEADVRRVPIGQLDKEYPGISYFLGVTAPGYSSDGRSALVYVQGFCSFDCGWGDIIVLEHKAGGWVVPIAISWVR